MLISSYARDSRRSEAVVIIERSADRSVYASEWDGMLFEDCSDAGEERKAGARKDCARVSASLETEEPGMIKTRR